MKPRLKICTKCGAEKPISEYHKNKHGKYGVRPECKECVKAINKGQYIFRRYEPREGETFEAWLKEYRKKHFRSPFVCKRPKVRINFPGHTNQLYCVESENWIFPHLLYYFKPSRPS